MNTNLSLSPRDSFSCPVSLSIPDHPVLINVNETKRNETRTSNSSCFKNYKRATLSDSFTFTTVANSKSKVSIEQKLKGCHNMLRDIKDDQRMFVTPEWRNVTRKMVISESFGKYTCPKSYFYGEKQSGRVIVIWKWNLYVARMLTLRSESLCPRA